MITDKQFEDAFTAAGGWFILTQFEKIYNWTGDKADLVDELYNEGYDSKRTGTALRVSSVIKIIEGDRGQEALVRIRDSKVINKAHPEASDMASELLAKYYSNVGQKKYSVTNAVWIAAALMTFEVCESKKNILRDNIYYKITDIVKRAQTLTAQTVQYARVHQWCCADVHKHTHKFLRADHEINSNLRRLTYADEFKEKTMPTDLDENDLLEMNGRIITMKELFDFVKEQYPSVVMLTKEDNVENDEQYEPLLSEYDPAIDAATYERLLISTCEYKQLDVLYYMYKMGGAATCKQIAKRYGSVYNHYLTNANNIAKNLAGETNCPLLKREDGRVQYWPVLFVGKDVDSKEEGVFKWKLREPLKEAIQNLEERGVFDNMKNEVSFAHNLILYGPPGTGKTYYTVIHAVAIAEKRPFEEVEKEAKADYQSVLDRYNVLKKAGRIAFTTFHQSYGYEEFIEGIKPIVDETKSEVGYSIEDGVFKAFCKTAEIPPTATVDHTAKIWKITLKQPGDSDLKRECFDDNVIKFNWKNLQESKESIEYFFIDQFKNRMQIGDIVVSYHGAATDIDGIAIVTGDAEYDETKASFRWSRTVKWIYQGSPINIQALNGNKYLSGDQIYWLKRVKINDLLQLAKPKVYQENDQNYVFIIDEINRGNISKIFGELITLIEETKRKGTDEEMSAILPYSAEPFSVPNNVYILGTMNTADRSIALMDTALRRRFEFIEMMPNPEVLREIGADKITEKGQELDVAQMLEVINKRIEYLYDREHTIGHAFFTKLKDDARIDSLAAIFQKSVVPLLQEYFYEDYEKIQLVLGDNEKEEALKFVKNSAIEDDIFNGPVSDITGLPETKFEIQKDAFMNIQSYKKIHKSL